MRAKIEFEQVEDKDLKAGGLRIRLIKFDDLFASKSITKTFRYKSAATGISSGVLFTPPLLGGYQTTTVPGSLIGLGACSDDPPLTYINLSAHTQIPLAVYGGSHIGYTEVTEYEIDGNNLSPNQPTIDVSSSLGKTVYTYINDPPILNTEFPYVPAPDLGFKNGKLRSRVVYRRENNDVFTKVSEIYNDYSEHQLTSLFVKGLNLKNRVTRFCYSCSPGMYAYNEYKYNTTWHRLDNTREVQYGDTETQKREILTEYFYENTASHRLPTSKEYSTNDGRRFREAYVRASGSPALITQQDMLVSRDGGSFVKIAGEKIAYYGLIPSSYRQWNAVTQAYELKVDNIFSSNKLKTQVRYASSETNPQTKGLITNYIWGYNNTYPVAQVVNATESEINNHLTTQQRNELNGTNPAAGSVQTYIQNLRDNLTNALVTTYTYTPLVGILSITDPAGFNIHFDYDDFRRLIRAKDHNEDIYDALQLFLPHRRYP